MLIEVLFAIIFHTTNELHEKKSNQRLISGTSEFFLNSARSSYANSVMAFQLCFLLSSFYNSLEHEFIKFVYKDFDSDIYSEVANRKALILQQRCAISASTSALFCSACAGWISSQIFGLLLLCSFLCRFSCFILILYLFFYEIVFHYPPKSKTFWLYTLRPEKKK